MNKLDDLRSQIDCCDERLVKLLAERIDLTKKIREVKKADNLPALVPDRWAELTAKHQEWCKQNNLDYSLAEPIFEEIHKFVLTKIHIGLKS